MGRKPRTAPRPRPAVAALARWGLACALGLVASTCSDEKGSTAGDDCESHEDCGENSFCLEIRYEESTPTTYCLRCYERYCSPDCATEADCPDGWSCVDGGCVDDERDCDPPGPPCS